MEVTFSTDEKLPCGQCPFYGYFDDRGDLGAECILDIVVKDFNWNWGECPFNEKNGGKLTIIRKIEEQDEV